MNGKVKLVVTIPAYNEQATVGQVITKIPNEIEGVRSIEVVVIDDGSTDNTAGCSEQAGAKVFSFSHIGEVCEMLKYDGLSLRASLPGPAPALIITPLNYDLRAEAYIDGEKTEIWRVNGALSGVWVSEGIHQIEFKISPDWYWTAVGIQWFLYVFVAGFFIVQGSREKGRNRADKAPAKYQEL